MRPLFSILLLSVWLLLSGTVSAGEYDSERRLYKDAVSAFKAKDKPRFKRVMKKLTHYPLYPYLQQSELLQRLDRVSDSELRRFIKRYSDLPLASRLLGKYLLKLGKRGEWSRYLKHYDGRDGAKYRCYALRAESRSKGVDKLLPQIEKIWLSGKSQPKACDPLFAVLDKSPRMTGALIWKRIGLAVEQGNITLANYLAKRLSKSDRARFTLWKQVRRDPAKYLPSKKLKRDDALNRRIVIYGSKRLARKDATKAWKQWSKIEHGYRFSDKDRAEVARYIVVRGGLQKRPETRDWITALKPQWINDEVLRWQAKLAIYQNDWPLLKRSIKALPKDQQQEKQWRYWQARAAEASGDRRSANKTYVDLAGTVSYYGFLSADKTKRPYHLTSIPLLDEDTGIEKIAALDAVKRTRELLHFNRNTEARREWHQLLSGFDNQQTRLAAVLASRWSWHDGAILTTARTGQLSDLELRFPTPFKQLVVKNAKRQKIDPEWVFGVLRRESAFMADAQSGVGALGLMQLMPKTARELSRSLGIKRLRSNDILQPSRNIQLGSSYLRRMLDRFNNNQALATAAYNAGPHRVDSWLPDSGTTPADEWVELIPYSETRDYVKAVMAYTTIFDDKLNRRTSSLKSRMKDVKR
ncbi:hypothetical protein BOW53_07240 [Solemya pervernicosa gill symbiont]|uniref:Transglycosylase SLT domain-containing protein n=2 Tax=Gammaproteobacteria incertae sedis TaxID=118884 RepID=A0A1T2L636_9GAMM|nr:transglycosylase SLT domain-containing protein [Candidatus Reidiella endopervernicosa]OOZ40567.1 hypothetical protein BOW53_07240 [Solemya pervernicosa gill symbiont]QKQ27606.1 transglycosylase SLT domain-containing protein [Candidatus Reidiella endopervernicosa]